MQGQWVIHTKTGCWIVNVGTTMNIPFRRIGNTYFMGAWVRVPDRGKDKSKDKMEVDSVKVSKAVWASRDDDLPVQVRGVLLGFQT